MENFLQNIFRHLVATTDLETHSKHLGADAEHHEVGELPNPEEESHELLVALDDLEAHDPAPQRVPPAEEAVLTVGAHEEAKHPGTANIKLQGGKGWDSQL